MKVLVLVSVITKSRRDSNTLCGTTSIDWKEAASNGDAAACGSSCFDQGNRLICGAAWIRSAIIGA
jgi:hypothetical protein